MMFGNKEVEGVILSDGHIKTNLILEPKIEKEFL